MSVIIGIDPGLDGAVAVIHPKGIVIYDTPIIDVGIGKKIRRKYNLKEMVSIISAIKLRDSFTECWIEDVHAMPGQGVTSMFSMGRGLGSWEAIVTALMIPLYFVSPVRWKKTIMDGMGKEKSAAVLKAQQIFPEACLKTPRGRLLDGRAEALLIAEYGRRYGAMNGKQ